MFGNLYFFQDGRLHERAEGMPLSFVLLCSIAGSEETVLVLRLPYRHSQNSSQPFSVQLVSAERNFEAEIPSKTWTFFFLLLFSSFYKNMHS